MDETDEYVDVHKRYGGIETFKFQVLICVTICHDFCCFNLFLQNTCRCGCSCFIDGTGTINSKDNYSQGTSK